LKTESAEPRMTRVRSLLEAGGNELRQAGVESWHLDAELLLAAAAGIARTVLLAGIVPADEPVAERFARLIARRAAREPLAYIVGHKEFRSLELEVGPAVLVPRPETETLVEVALEIMAGRGGARMLDLGTGSGAIALAIAAEARSARVVATDVSIDALAVARRNAVRLGLEGRVELREADCFVVKDGGEPLGRFDLIVANPPYIRDEEIDVLQAEVSRYEPRVALAGGIDGMDFYRTIARGAQSHLHPGGRVAVEVGAGQAAEVTAIFQTAGLSEVTTRSDLAGIARVVCSSG
jgi:release factor glutamine methyltransferase